MLWLADNQISCIAGLSHLTALQELNLARNLIEVVGNTLEANTAVQVLNLADNSLGSFKQVRLSVLALPHAYFAAALTENLTAVSWLQLSWCTVLLYMIWRTCIAHAWCT